MNHSPEVFWTRCLRQWELEEVLKLNEIIDDIVLSEGEDRLVWLKVKQAYNCKEGRLFLEGNSCLQSLKWIFIWKIKAPPKVLIFLWKFHNMILPSKSLLKGRLGNLMINSSCSWCLLDEETQDHIFWFCPHVSKLWDEMFKWWGLAINPRGFQLANIWELHNQFSNSSVRLGWNCCVAACLWSIWLSRNRLVFEGENMKATDLIHLVKIRSFKWCSAVGLVNEVMDSRWFIYQATPIELHNIRCSKLLFLDDCQIF